MKTISERIDISCSRINIDSELDYLWLIQQRLSRENYQNTVEFDLLQQLMSHFHNVSHAPGSDGGV